MKEYEIVIGLEVHVELATCSKLFCSCSTKFGARPNKNICPACVGMPGVLPHLNKRAVELAIAAGLVTNSEISSSCRFDKKNYFYPDLATGYQRTQFYAPICKNGYVDIEIGDDKKRIGIKQIHIEEDAGKLIHVDNHSLVDYNRCGVPLIEIVSAPDFRSSDEVTFFLEKLRSLLSFADVSDCKMQEGSMRCDVNLSVRKVGVDKLGVRTEMKNLNSLSAISRAIKYESERQITLLASGEAIIQETRRWDDEACASFSMRTKEDAGDYRYFPDPDVLPLYISSDWIEEIKGRLPEQAEDKLENMTKHLNVSEFDAVVITKSKRLSDIFDSLVSKNIQPKDAANWIVTEILALDVGKNKSADDIVIDCDKLASLIKMVSEKKINRATAKKILELIYLCDVDPQKYVEENDLFMLSDDGVIRTAIHEIFEENPNALRQYKEGSLKVATFLFGRAMKKMAGKADPSMIKAILETELSKI